MPPDLETALRELTPHVLGILVRRYRDFAAAEDAVQEALLAAAIQWPREGIPGNPRAWLTQVASRRLTDQIRTEGARRRRESDSVMESGYVVRPLDLDCRPGAQDDTLTLIYMCCHPALTTPSAIALTLRAVGGLTTAEIARAFLVPETTMAQRVSRATQIIKASGALFQLPSKRDQAHSLRAVLHVLYLIFNEGYTATAGEHLLRADLASEAIRLTRAVYAQLPQDAEVAGLLALMLLTDARRSARTGPHGEVIPIDQQERGLWNRDQIAEGVALVSAALARGSVGPYQLQAAIAAVHDEAARAEDTDWPQILALYDLLQRMSPNPIVKLNHAVASAMVHGPWVGLALLEPLDRDGKLRDHHRLYAVRGHLLEMAGDAEGAIRNYAAAARLTASLPERNYLLAQIARKRDGGAG